MNPRARPLPPRLEALARRMAWHFWPALHPRDALLVPEPPPAAFLSYLEALGLDLPEFVLDTVPEKRFTPFGWNREAMEKNAATRHPEPHPPGEVIARVNGRAFAVDLERELFRSEWDAEGSRPVFAGAAEELDAWLSGRPQGRWVAKGNHSHGGIGQWRFDARAEAGSAETRRKLLETLREYGGLALEPEHSLQTEFGVLFLLGKNGTMAGPRMHRLLSRSGGGFIGAMILPGDGEIERRRTHIDKAAAAIAGVLLRAGYFGPVGLDMYAHAEDGRSRFRSLVDLNARCSMAYPAHGLAHRFPDRAVLGCQLSSRVYGFPAAPEGFRARLGGLHFDPVRREGAFRLTPSEGMARQGLAFVARDEGELLHLREETLGLFRHD